jgi:adenylyltransferase/sulfurtransferase
VSTQVASTASAASLIDPADSSGRYVRQTIFPAIGRDGQRRLARTHVLLVGCGALGSAVADLLVRAGVGRLTIADRDYVELNNLQRQSLYNEADVANHVPKAAAAAERLSQVNSAVEVVPVVADVDATSVEKLLESADILVDGTDNFETRYLLNDAAVKLRRPWVYGGVIASYGMTMTIRPGETPCLRCVFPDPPDAGSAPTCDTAGVIGPAVHLVASLQATEALKLAVGDLDSVNRELIAVDLWRLSFDRIPLGVPTPDCPACQRRDFAFLDRATPSRTTVLCGHDAVQVRVHPPVKLDLATLGERLTAAGEVMSNQYLLRFRDATSPYELTVFPDGRAIVKGTSDPVEARVLYARYVGL